MDGRDSHAVCTAQGMKRNAARAALEFVEAGGVLGVGSGSTVCEFVQLLAEAGHKVPTAVAASDETARRLTEVGIGVVELGAEHPAVYVDGADEVDLAGRAIKGGGAAHVREKAIAIASHFWVCIVDESKLSRKLGHVPVPLEVKPSAVGSVTTAIAEMGAVAHLRPEVLTDAGNPVLDVYGLNFQWPMEVESALDAIPGVIGNGVFAMRTADVILVGRCNGEVSRIIPSPVELPSGPPGGPSSLY